MVGVHEGGGASPAGSFGGLPDPGTAATLDGLVERLRLLKVWAGDPSFEGIKNRVNAVWRAEGRVHGELAGKTTVVDCFRLGRRRLNADLVVAVVHALHPDPGYVAQWRQALRVVGGEIEAAGQVRVHTALPADLADFTGREAELARLRAIARGSRWASAVVISAIEGMAGVGKTQLAIHAAHELACSSPFDQVMFVNLRGFHHDPAQPPAEPAAVLDGFLRVLGVPGQQIPHELDARVAAYRALLAGRRVLVVLDNAATADQVAPLLPDSPGCIGLVTSRRHLAGLPRTAHLVVDVFSPDEAVEFLAAAAPRIPVGADPTAAARIAHSCGYLPLALGLVAGHLNRTPGWTLSEHADRLEQRRRRRRLDAGVELAFEVSYRRLRPARRRLVRLLALHPGPDFDAYAVAALAGTGLSAARGGVRGLCADHVLQETGVGRYTFHDLIRDFAAERATDEDPPSARRAALTRLFDYHLAASAAAMDSLYPAEAHRRPRIEAARTPVPDLADLDTARAWLDAERASLVAVAAHTAGGGWPRHTTRLSALLYRYLDGGHHLDAVVVHSHAVDVADPADPTDQAQALTNLGTAYLQLGRYREATERLRHGLDLFIHAGDRPGQARVLGNLGLIEERLGRYQPAIGYLERVLVLFAAIGDRIGEAHTLTNLGVVEERLGRLDAAADHHRQALKAFQDLGDRTGQAHALTNLGDVEVRLGQYTAAAEHLDHVLALSRQLGNPDSTARALNSLGILHTRLGDQAQATEYHQQALAIARDNHDQQAEAWARNGLGEAACRLGAAADALAHHTAAHTVATTIGAGDQHARAHAGLGDAQLALGNLDQARENYAHAVRLYTQLGMPEGDALRARHQLPASTSQTPRPRR